MAEVFVVMLSGEVSGGSFEFGNSVLEFIGVFDVGFDCFWTRWTCFLATSPLCMPQGLRRALGRQRRCLLCEMLSEQAFSLRGERSLREWPKSALVQK